MNNRVERAFNSYQVKVYGRPVGGIQEQEIKRAFFAAVHWALFVMPEDLDPGDVETERDISIMSEISDEVQQFAVSVLKAAGRA